jgi:hypothetical protein
MKAGCVRAFEALRGEDAAALPPPPAAALPGAGAALAPPPLAVPSAPLVVCWCAGVGQEPPA